MTQNDETEKVIAQQAAAMREALERARLRGRREALDIIKTKLSGGIFGLRFTPEGENEILGLSPLMPENVAEKVSFGPVGASAPMSGHRVIPGTVRPTIIAALSNSRGLRPSEVTSTTQLKENTVRGTLRALGLEGIAVKRGDLWFLAGQPESSSPKGETEAVGASVHVNR